jgi:type IV pilus assembly protein PilB
MASTSPTARELVPDAFIQEHRVVPLERDEDVLRIGAAGSVPAPVLDELAFLTGTEVRAKELPPDEVETFLEEENLAANGGASEAGVKQESGPSETESLDAGSVIQQVERIIHEAIDKGVSDVHIEPYESFFRVRYRLDGVLHTVGRLELVQRDAIISRLKIMSGLDIAEKRRPQDSRIRVDHENRSVDLRVSTLPTAHGEKVVLRVLDKSALTLDLDVLGFEDDDLAQFERAIQNPNGQILVTGPTGSGKTTTLYSALDTLNTEHVNITTIEDPIEYNLSGINQAQVRADIGFTFAQALRAFLRQDPNIIMVGEIRDKETADIAVRAALTGHLVLSTLHTNDAPSTVTRLVDMGVEPYLVASSVRLVAAQRLVRCVCPTCKTATDVDPAVAEEIGLAPNTNVVAGEGCEACSGTGFQGRTALFEIMPLSKSIAEMVTDGASTSDLRTQAKREGMHTLREAGAHKIRRGVTTPEEVLRETVA